jgi:hypothetical protein
LDLDICIYQIMGYVFIRLLLIGLFQSALLSGAASSDHFPTAPYTGDVIIRDVCIIGGGSAGTFTAVRLSDMGQSVVVVEKENILGGHTNTFVDPVTKATVDFGVEIWHNLTVVTNYLARLNVELANANVNARNTGQQSFADFNTGKALTNFSTPADATSALQAYANVLERFTFLNGGFDLPTPVPADLLISFGDFVQKFGLESMVDTAAGLGQTVGVILEKPTIYVIKVFGQDILRNLFDNAFVNTAEHDNSLLYQSAARLLGDNVLFNSRVLQTTRTSNGVSVLVKTPSGQRLIKAKALVIAIPQVPSNLVGFDLSEEETSLFKSFKGVGYWTGLLNNTGLPAGLTVTNMDASTPNNLPTLPGVFAFSPTSIPGIIDFKFGTPGPDDMSDAAVQQAIVAALLRLRRAGLNTTVPDFVAFKNHSPYSMEVSPDDIQNGFYKCFNALQGQRRTWYTGAALVAQDSSLIWNFTETLLPQIADSR